MIHNGPRDWKQIDTLLSNHSVPTAFVLPKDRTWQGWCVLCISDRFSSFPALSSNMHHRFINSTPFLTTPTTAPVWIVSLPPPETRCSISASPSSHVIMTSGLTSNFASSSDNAVIISANASPRVTLRALIVFKQLMTSDVPSNVEMISLIASGGGAAMQL